MRAPGGKKMDHTFASINDANALLPTRGVPKVIALITVPEGRLRVKYSASSSAMAPPRECPT